jgi:hypothetical protein
MQPARRPPVRALLASSRAAVAWRRRSKPRPTARETGLGDRGEVYVVDRRPTFRERGGGTTDRLLNRWYVKPSSNTTSPFTMRLEAPTTANRPGTSLTPCCAATMSRISRDMESGTPRPARSSRLECSKKAETPSSNSRMSMLATVSGMAPPVSALATNPARATSTTDQPGVSADHDRSRRRMRAAPKQSRHQDAAAVCLPSERPQFNLQGECVQGGRYCLSPLRQRPASGFHAVRGQPSQYASTCRSDVGRVDDRC